MVIEHIVFCFRANLNRSVLTNSQLVEETNSRIVERYGLPLPVLITEALTYADSEYSVLVFP